MSMKISKGKLIGVFCVLMFVLGNTIISDYLTIINYFDELFGLIGFLLIFLYPGRSKKTFKKYIALYLVFIGITFTGNLVYNYQSYQLVFQDILANSKFFGSIITAYFIFYNYKFEGYNLQGIAKRITCVLFVLLVFDVLFHIFPSDELRYGIRPTQLFYCVPTYFAGVLGFLVALLSLKNTKQNIVYIIMNLCMLISTLRSKAFFVVVTYLFLLWHIKIRKKKLKVMQMVMLGLAGVLLAWNQIYFYYIELSGASARSVLTIKSIEIAKDYFPIGVGFASYASHAAALAYSPVYYLYGVDAFWELSPNNPHAFLDDTFWPIIVAQSGFVGVVCYICLLCVIFKCLVKAKSLSTDMYLTVLFVFIYLLISSTSEPIFNNAISVPFAMILGSVWAYLNKNSYLKNQVLINEGYKNRDTYISRS